MDKLLNNQPWFNEKECFINDFPINGIKFLDIFHLLSIDEVNQELDAELRSDSQIVFIPEARGFLFAPYFGLKKVIPLRKENKLPGEVVEIPFQKEYAKDVLCYMPSALNSKVEKIRESGSCKEIHVSFFDDILATGGTALAVINHFNGSTSFVTNNW